MNRLTHPLGLKPLSHPLIKASHKGLLHKDTGTPLGEKIPESKIVAAEHSPSPAVRKRAVFAENFRH
jgi:hypothetical protein